MVGTTAGVTTTGTATAVAVTPGTVQTDKTHVLPVVVHYAAEAPTHSYLAGAAGVVQNDATHVFVDVTQAVPPIVHAVNVAKAGIVQTVLVHLTVPGILVQSPSTVHVTVESTAGVVQTNETHVLPVPVVVAVQSLSYVHATGSTGVIKVVNINAMIII